MPILRILYSAIRGMLIGVAEIMPGISGGTIALITGVYETIITSAGHVLSGLRALATDRGRAREEFARADWAIIVPLVLGMVPAVLIAARVLAPVVEQHPVPTFGLFLGMTATAIIVPISMTSQRWTLRQVLLALAVAAAVFVLVGLPPGELEPVWPVVFAAAAVAVCALVLPGTSGAFILLTFGLYEPTLAALNARDVGYVAVFLAGAFTGFALFIKGLQWLLQHRRQITLVILTGVVCGAVRALWPWQNDQRDLLVPDEQIALTVIMVLLGAAVVLGLFILGRRIDRSASAGRTGKSSLSDS